MFEQSKLLSVTLDPFAFLLGGGEMGARTRAFDWSNTPVGPASNWPQSLKIALRIMVGSRYAMWMGWGPEFTFFYNDAYATMTLGSKHPWALGRSAREVWAEIWPDIGPRAEQVIATGEATWDEGLLLFLERHGFKEESYHTFSYSPIPDDSGMVGGMLCVVTEDTERTIGERRLRTLRELAARTTDEAKSAEAACETAATVLADNPYDLPFVLIYLLDDDSHARLAGRSGLPPDSAAAPSSLSLSPIEQQRFTWPLHKVLASNQAEVVSALGDQFRPLNCGIWPEPPHQAVVVPLSKPGQTRPAGFLIAGVSPRLNFDDDYKGFLELLAGHAATAVSNARAYEEERRRVEALAELDRAKTAFFSNVSHEFRTPLTLMLGPVEDLLARSHTNLSPAAAEQLAIVNRNGLRLLRLVNTLLDFSRIEAGRVKAVYQATDLAAYTTDLASVFRSACERAGLNLVVACPPLPEPVYVDREMWEKLVLNLLSNAFKFTLEGEIKVSLQPYQHSAVLRVQDTGIGIPAEEVPRLFERFHRVRNAGGRTHEGSGIGLALVQDLVRLHGGSVTAESTVNRGTSFVVTLPLGKAHLPADQIGAGHPGFANATGGTPYVEEALRWLPEDRTVTTCVGAPSFVEPLATPCPAPLLLTEDDDRPRVLIADDNADMREYLTRLLGEEFRVETVPDGQAALASAIEQPPDVILTDVMMPRLDGFGLLRELRTEPRTQNVPIILLSARAGEESRIEGMEAGADDYLVKPFSARELLARVSAHVQMAHLRQESDRALRESEERYRLIGQAANDAIWDWDLVTNRVTWNEGVRRVFGYTEDQIGPDASWWYEHIHSDDRARVIREVHTAIEGGIEFWHAEYRYQRADGSYAHVFDRGQVVRKEGKPVRMVGSMLDLTQRRRAEEQIREAEARFRIMADNSPVSIWQTDTNGVTFVNRHYLDYFGRPFEEIAGVGWVEFLHPDDREYLDVYASAFSGRTRYEAQSRFRRHDGEYRWLQNVGTPHYSSDGTFIGFLGCSVDVTDLKRAEAALVESDRRKDEFLATLAHELRNPLAPIRNGLQVLKLAKNDPAAMERARCMMERQLGQMVRLIDDLLDLTRISRGKIGLQKTRLPLASAVRNAVETSRPLIEQAGHDFIVEVPDTPIFVDADETRLSQVFANLLNNAAKYTESGGRIRLAVEQQDHDVLVTVEDNGLGIPVHMLPLVFDMFTQVDRGSASLQGQGGLGIGLNIARRLVEMHHGTIKAESGGHGMGSKFTVRLPVLRALAQELRTDEPDKPAHSEGLRVLVVDDNRDAATSLAMMLNIMGHDTQTAYDGLEAIAVATAFRPDMILLDIGMPKLNGYDTCRHIRGQPWGKDVVIVAQTGWGQSDAKQSSSAAGFDLHLVKPIDPATLGKLLSERKNATG